MPRLAKDLKEILDTTNVVIVDTNVLRPHPLYDGCSRDVVKYMGSAGIGQLDYAFLDLIVRDAELANLVLERPNIFTLPEVTSEYAGFVRKFKTALDYMKSHKPTGSPKNRGRRPITTMEELGREKLNQFQHAIKKTKQLIRDAECEVEYPEILEGISEYLIALDSRYNLKKRKSNGREDLRTDEKLVALAVYQSLMRNQKSVILTSDKDLPNLARALFRLEDVGLDTPLEDMKDALTNNPFIVYRILSLQAGIASRIDSTNVLRIGVYK